MNQIADKYDVSATTIERVLKRNSVKIRTSAEARDKYHIDLEKLSSEVNTMSNQELAEKYGCSANLIAVRKYQIKKGRVVI